MAHTISDEIAPPFPITPRTSNDQTENPEEAEVDER